VVATERVLAGLAEGGFRAGEDLLTAADDEEMAESLAALLGDAALRGRLAAAARRRLEAAYDWEVNLKRFEQVLAEVATPAEPASAGAEPRPETPRSAWSA
jgi:glycosyltransferase involved in cell wall biosynthesis